jgi:predicted nucleic acid-binding protein
LAISVVSLAELYEGIHYSRDPARGREVLARFLEGVTVLSLDEGICDRFGLERGRLRQQRLAVGDFDLLIAATCLRHGLKLARTTGATSRWSRGSRSSTWRERRGAPVSFEGRPAVSFPSWSSI